LDQNAGWAVAQNPYLLPKKLTIAQAAAPSATLTTILIIFGVAIVLVLQSIGLLFTLVQRNLLEESTRPSEPSSDAGAIAAGAPAAGGGSPS
jgi:cytochrome d ubiquinol oxidase subunit II